MERFLVASCGHVIARGSLRKVQELAVKLSEQRGLWTEIAMSATEKQQSDLRALVGCEVCR